MTEATRNVTIILNVKPGEIVKPDLSWLAAARQETELLTKETTSLTETTKAMRAESQELAKTQAEMAAQEKQHTKAVKDTADATKQSAEEQSKANAEELAKRKRDHEEYMAWYEGRQRLYAENARRIAQEQADKQKQIIVQQKQEQEQAAQQTAFVPDTVRRPITEPGQPNQARLERERKAAEDAAKFQEEQLKITLRKRGEEIEKAILKEQSEREKEDQKEAERQRKEEEARFEAAEKRLVKIRIAELRAVRERKADADREREEEEERQQKRYDTAQKILQQIRKDELEHIRERREAAEEAEADMPKAWRNVQLNLSQAIASTGRFISHLKMLKNVGGESLEDLAKQFVTVQSRVEVISATSSAFTNLGTMLDGLREAGRLTEAVVAQQQALGIATTFSQSATIRLAGAAGTLSTMLGPVQLITTGIMTAIVAADLAMDFFGESAEKAKQQNEQHLKGFNEELTKAIEKLKIERDLLNGHTEIMKAQWELKRAMAGTAGLNASQLREQTEQERQANDAAATKAMRDSAKDIFDKNMTDEQKTEKARLADERKKNSEGLRSLQLQLEEIVNTEGEADTTTQNMYRSGIAKYKEKLAQLDKDQAMFDMKTGASLIQTAASAQFKDGQIQDLPGFLKAVNDLPAVMKDSGSQLLLTAQSKMLEDQQLLRSRMTEARSVAGQMPSDISEQRSKIKELEDKQEQEKALAARFGLTEVKTNVGLAERALDQFGGASADQRAILAKQAQDALSQAGVMTPELQKELSRGINMRPQVVREQIKDASEYDQREQSESDQAIAKATSAIVAMEDQAKTMTRLAKDLEKQAKANAQQLEMLRQAIQNRDAN